MPIVYFGPTSPKGLRKIGFSRWPVGTFRFYALTEAYFKLGSMVDYGCSFRSCATKVSLRPPRFPSRGGRRLLLPASIRSDKISGMRNARIFRTRKCHSVTAVAHQFDSIPARSMTKKRFCVSMKLA